MLIYFKFKNLCNLFLEFILTNEMLVLSILNEAGFTIISDQINRLLQNQILNSSNLQEYFTLPNKKMDISILEQIINVLETKMETKSQKVILLILLFL